ncbi:WecB/TagA/CpsF family glycosyltransferase [Thalassococcus sp. S3]|uniref:WecB/TagA/CpsF family glycosyltransferase n=1 Tax=Thalassococcus sp. S3 TaxID=2017482 RepID=UPI00102488DB|nr:WecB/TagA/CpsF family glycosyltransferase [Thalassococcus sp. S3]QBF31983.1 glycosyltransferase [Thalassococcus sp. S3]
MQFQFDQTVIRINIPTRAALMKAVEARFQAGEGFALATVNLDHLVKMQGDSDFVQAYAAQDLVVADGRPIVALSQLAGRPVDLVPGSDMVLPLARLAAQQGVKVALVGSTQQALSDAERVLKTEAPEIDIVLSIAPSGIFDPDGSEAREILEKLQAGDVGLCYLALGAPKQERLAALGRQIAPRVGFASIGAGLDFLGGHQVRAPLWMRRAALEWVWRILGAPGRMIPRYARCFAILPVQVVRALRLRGEKV